MGDIISIGDSLVITVFSMAVVFLGLIALSFCISILKSVSVEKKTELTKAAGAPSKTKEVQVKETDTNNTNDEELVAVIAAAIAASLGVSIPEINIKSIRRIPQSTTAWAAAGRQEQIYGKL